MMNSRMLLVAGLARFADRQATPMNIVTVGPSAFASIVGPTVVVTLLVLGDPLSIGILALTFGVFAFLGLGRCVPLQATPSRRWWRRCLLPGR